MQVMLPVVAAYVPKAHKVQFAKPLELAEEPTAQALLTVVP